MESSSCLNLEPPCSHVFFLHTNNYPIYCRLSLSVPIWSLLQKEKKKEWGPYY
jgi:hypothetical protein